MFAVSAAPLCSGPCYHRAVDRGYGLAATRSLRGVRPSGEVLSKHMTPGSLINPCIIRGSE